VLDEGVALEGGPGGAESVSRCGVDKGLSMGGRILKSQKRRGIVGASGLVSAICLLTSLTSASAQDPDANPALPGAVPQKTDTATAPAQMGGHQSEDYTVSPEDLLDVFVMDVPEVTRMYRVSSNGFLTLPLLPQPLAVSGLTLGQVSALITNKFREAGMLNNAQVTVSLKETRLHTVTISGTVLHPGSYPVYGPTKLFDVLIAAGGPSLDAGDEAIITRAQATAPAETGESGQPVQANAPSKEQSFTVDIRKLVETGVDTTNTTLYPGDRVILKRAPAVYILGAVNRPGIYILTATQAQITVLKALAEAGGLTNVAKRNHITVMRKDPALPEGKREEVNVDFKAIVAGQKPDMKLLADDILFIPESGGIKAMREVVNTSIGIGTGLAIYRF